MLVAKCFNLIIFVTLQESFPLVAQAFSIRDPTVCPDRFRTQPTAVGWGEGKMGFEHRSF